MSQDLIGGMTGTTEPSWPPRDSHFTQTRDHEIVWTTAGKFERMLYLVEDVGSTFKPYIDRFFIFADPQEAIEKVRVLCQADPMIVTKFGDTKLSALEPDMLKPGTRYLFQKDHIEVFIIAVPLTGKWW